MPSLGHADTPWHCKLANMFSIWLRLSRPNTDTLLHRSAVHRAINRNEDRE
jgi:hypothetical protein